VDLELKVVADVGIIGIPNAGKSTLLSVVTSAKPKIANYPFTTLVPNLGVCEMDYRTTVFADVPGLLEGAHEGLGLGHEFLRHVQRCRALIHVIDGTSPDPMGDFRAINLELELFNPELKDKRQVKNPEIPLNLKSWFWSNRSGLEEDRGEGEGQRGEPPHPPHTPFPPNILSLPLSHAPLLCVARLPWACLQVVAYNKIDVPDSGDFADVMREELMAEGVAESDIFPISAATGQGVLDLVRRVRALLDEMGPAKQVRHSTLPAARAAPLHLSDSDGRTIQDASFSFVHSLSLTHTLTGVRDQRAEQDQAAPARGHDRPPGRLHHRDRARAQGHDRLLCGRLCAQQVCPDDKLGLLRGGQALPEGAERRRHQRGAAGEGRQGGGHSGDQRDRADLERRPVRLGAVRCVQGGAQGAGQERAGVDKVAQAGRRLLGSLPERFFGGVAGAVIMLLLRQCRWGGGGVGTGCCN
jgi:hypothetical protein